MESIHHDAVKNYFQRLSRLCHHFHSSPVAEDGDMRPLKSIASFPPAQDPAGIGGVPLSLLPWSIPTGKLGKPVALGKVIRALGLNFCIFKFKKVELLRSQLLQRDSLENM